MNNPAEHNVSLELGTQGKGSVAYTQNTLWPINP